MDLEDRTEYPVKRYIQKLVFTRKFIFKDRIIVDDKDRLICSFSHIRMLVIGETKHHSPGVLSKIPGIKRLTKPSKRDPYSSYHFTIVHLKGDGSGYGAKEYQGSHTEPAWESNFSTGTRNDRSQILMKIMTKLPNTKKNRTYAQLIKNLHEGVFEVDAGDTSTNEVNRLRAKLKQNYFEHEKNRNPSHHKLQAQNQVLERRLEEEKAEHKAYKQIYMMGDICGDEVAQCECSESSEMSEGEVIWV